MRPCRFFWHITLEHCVACWVYKNSRSSALLYSSHYCVSLTHRAVSQPPRQCNNTFIFAILFYSCFLGTIHLRYSSEHSGAKTMEINVHSFEDDPLRLRISVVSVNYKDRLICDGALASGITAATSMLMTKAMTG